MHFVFAKRYLLPKRHESYREITLVSKIVPLYVTFPFSGQLAIRCQPEKEKMKQLECG